MENINNEQLLTNKETNENKKDTKKIALLVIFILLTTIILTGFRIYKNVIDVSDKNRDKFDYNLSNISDNEYNYLDFINYDSKNNPNSLQISMPKEYIYKEIIDIKGFADDLNTKYGLKLKQIGFSSNNSEENCIDIYADTTYKKLINAYISGILQYEFTSDNGIKVYLKSITVGDGLPNALYEDLLPLKVGDLVYEVKSSDYNLLNENVLDLKFINSVNTDKNNLNFKFDYMSNLKEVSEFIFKDKANEINQPLEEIMPVILDIMFNPN